MSTTIDTALGAAPRQFAMTREHRLKRPIRKD